jgi:hypothetical protein
MQTNANKKEEGKKPPVIVELKKTKRGVLYLICPRRSGFIAGDFIILSKWRATQNEISK